MYNCVCVVNGCSYYNTVVSVMNGHPRGQANVSVHCRWPLIRGTDGLVEMSRDIDNVAVHSRWPLTTGVAQGRYYCNVFCFNECQTYVGFFLKNCIRFYEELHCYVI